MPEIGNGRVLSSTYEWEIENYSSYNKMAMDERIRSPPFNVCNNSWCMILYPSGDSVKSQEFISLFLSLQNNKVPAGVEIHVQYTFHLIDDKRKVIATFTPGRISIFHETSGNLGTKKFVSKSLVMDNLNETSTDKITIVCEVILKKEKSYLLTSHSDRLQHFEGLRTMINNPKFSDVTFVVENNEIFAHKMMLASSSTVFAAMFEHKMRENEENIVKIEDISYNIFSELLRFIYTGECTMSEDVVSELFEAADKYQLLKLKGTCEEELCKNINVKNVIATLQLEDMHSVERLKKEAIDFIMLHGKEMIDKPEFESLTNLDAKLLKDVFREVFTRLK